MKFCISNIAWLQQEDENIYSLMKKYGFHGLEIAPNRISERVFDEPQETIESFKQSVEKHNISLVAMQSLLYRRQDLLLFGDDSSRKNLLLQLEKCMVLAEHLGIKALIFGSPKNRCTNGLKQEVAEKIAIDFFQEAGDKAQKHNTILCMEPNPKEYSTDFINTTLEGWEFVKKVNHPGFCLHIDTGTILINKEPWEKILPETLKWIGHFHVSAPFLALPGDPEFHRSMAQLLRKHDYSGWISIEMKQGIMEKNEEAVLQALEKVRDWYGIL